MSRSVMRGVPYSREIMTAELVAAPVWGTGAARGQPTSLFFFFGEGASEVLCRSGFADRLEDRGGQRVGGGLAGPHDVLKVWVEALAFADRHFHEVVELLGLESLGAAQRDGVAEHWQAFLGPDVEMAEPHFFVDQGQQPVDLAVPFVGDADVVGAG